MTIVLESRRDLTLDAYHEVAWSGQPVRFHENAVARMTLCREAFERLIDSDEDIVIYGVTTGYGQNAKQRLSREERKEQAARPPMATLTSFGEPLPERVSRGIVFARLSNFVEGHAAITPALAEAVAGLLDGDALPAVPALGNGCPGEILALGHLFMPLASTFPPGGEGQPLADQRQSLCHGLAGRRRAGRQRPRLPGDRGLRAGRRGPDGAAAAL